MPKNNATILPELQFINIIRAAQNLKCSVQDLCDHALDFPQKNLIGEFKIYAQIEQNYIKRSIKSYVLNYEISQRDPDNEIENYLIDGNINDEDWHLAAEDLEAETSDKKYSAQEIEILDLELENPFIEARLDNQLLTTPEIAP